VDDLRELIQRLCLDLTDPFAGYPKDLAQLFERFRVFAYLAIVQNVLLARRESLEAFSNFRASSMNRAR
jgi:hypothetical protein